VIPVLFETNANFIKSLPVKNWRTFWFNSPGIDIPPGVDTKIPSGLALSSLLGLTCSTSK
jgi:hypothetical protein